ncbi:MAG: kelch repeat-containing protein [Leptospira sp.]|nr:kelch repeat-containing protein [Leptospira sp.]
MSTVFKIYIGTFLFLNLCCSMNDSNQNNKLLNALASEIVNLNIEPSISSTPEVESVLTNFTELKIKFPYPIVSIMTRNDFTIEGEAKGSLEIIEFNEQSKKDITLVFKGEPEEGEFFLLISDHKYMGKFGEENKSFRLRYVISRKSPTATLNFNDGDFPSFLDDGFLDIKFSEPVNGASIKENYSFSEPMANEVAIINVLSLSANEYRLVLSGKPYLSYTKISLTLTNITDKAGETLSKKTYDYYQPMIKSLGNLNTNRCYPRLVTLNNGNIMIIGGIEPNSNPAVTISSIEVFNPSTNQFSNYAFSLNQSRSDFTANLLSNGKVIVVAGLKGPSSNLTNFLSDFEILDPEEIQSPVTGTLPAQVRYGHKSAFGVDGNLYILGGRGTPAAGNSLAYLSRVDRYLLASNTFENVRNLASGRDGLDVVAGVNGKILVTGGILSQSFHANTFEWYDPTIAVGTNESSTLLNTRRLHTVLKYGENEYYILGGGNLDKITAIEKIAKDGSVSLVGNFSEQRYLAGFSFWNDKHILAIGGNTDGGNSYSLESLNLMNNRIYTVGALNYRSTCTSIHQISKTDILVITGENPVQRIKISE